MFFSLLPSCFSPYSCFQQLVYDVVDSEWSDVYLSRSCLGLRLISFIIFLLEILDYCVFKYLLPSASVPFDNVL